MWQGSQNGHARNRFTPTAVRAVLSTCRCTIGLPGNSQGFQRDATKTTTTEPVLASDVQVNGEFSSSSSKTPTPTPPPLPTTTTTTTTSTTTTTAAAAAAAATATVLQA